VKLLHNEKGEKSTMGINSKDSIEEVTLTASLETGEKKWSTKQIEKRLIEILTQQDLKTQKEIAVVLSQETKETKSQSYVSRLINNMDPQPVRNAEGFWKMPAPTAYKTNLAQLEELFATTGEKAYFFGEIQVAFLRELAPNYNALIAKKIADTFKKEVLTTFCPNEKDVIIYYRLRKRDPGGVEEGGSKGESIANKKGETDVEKYRPSVMRREIRRICKEIREKNNNPTKEENP
jgi:arginine repressor